MKKLYFFALLCSLSIASFAQTTVTIYATNASGAAYTTGNSDGISRIPNNITVVNNTEVGYAVFDLGAANIPSGATIMSVSTGFYLNSAVNGGGNCYIFGYSGNLSTVAVPATLYADMLPPVSYPGGMTFPTGAIYMGPFGIVAGNVNYGTNIGAVNFIQANVSVPTPSKVTLSYAAALPPPVAQYDIAGESGVASTTTAGHAPFLTITYCALPTAVSAIASPNPVCEGSTLTLNGGGDSVSDWLWAGPNGFTSTDQNPTLTATTLVAGIYTLTASNVCGATVNTITVTSPAVVVSPGPITGVTNAWVGFSTALSDPTPGGSWTSSNSAIATVGSSSGVVWGVSPGSVVITYTSPLGCVFTTNVQIVQSVFSQIPLVDPGALGTGFPIVAWYPFCGDTLDHSYYPVIGGHDLINYGANTTPATLTTDRFGLPDNAYAFNGSTSMMQYTTFFSISGPTGDFTYSCWFEPDVAQNSIILYNGSYGTDGWGFVMNGNSVGVEFLGTLYISAPITLNRWHNAMLKKNGNSYNFYVDNVSIGFFIDPVLTTPPISGFFVLGMDYNSTVGAGPLAKAYSGRIDDITIYNRQLSAAERDSLYNFNPDARTFTLGNDTTICVDSISISPLPPTIGNHYEWLSGGSVIPGETDSVLTVYPAPGFAGNIYSLIVGKPYGCLTSDNITVYSQPIPVHVGLDTIKVCAGDTITLGDGAFPTSSFIWNTGDTSHFINVTTTGLYTVSVDSVFHYGPGASDTITCIGRDTVTVHFYPVPFIGLPPFDAHCDGSHDSVKPFYDPAYTYAWGTPGFPNLSTLPFVVDSIIGTTTFWVKVTDTGCSRYDTINVLIVWDTLTFSVGDSAICKGQSVTISSASVTNNFIANYQWTPTAGIPNSNVYDPIITPDTSATYILKVSYPGCADIIDSFHIDVQPNPLVFLGNSRSICQFDTLHFSSVIDPAWYTHYSYSWTPTRFLDSINTPIVVFTADTASDTELLFLTVTTPNGCTGKDSVEIVVHPGQFDSLSADTTICPGDTVQLHPYLNLDGVGQGVVPSAYIWSPSIYLDDSNSFTPTVRAITTTQYRMIGISQYGCRDTLTATIRVSPAAVIYLGDSVTIYPGESYQILPQTNCVTFQWFPPQGLDNDKSSNPVATPDVHTKYIVWGVTEDGCKTSDSITIRVDPGNYITLPNAFTPGASVNSRFFVFKRGIVALHYFRIFNRWGNKVFETNNIDEGWDGKFNGKPQPFDVYTYEVEAESVTGKVYNRVGNVTLVR